MTNLHSCHHSQFFKRPLRKRRGLWEERLSDRHRANHLSYLDIKNFLCCKMSFYVISFPNLLSPVYKLCFFYFIEPNQQVGSGIWITVFDSDHLYFQGIEQSRHAFWTSVYWALPSPLVCKGIFLFPCYFLPVGGTKLKFFLPLATSWGHACGLQRSLNQK